ncbi:hypothetical protein AVEN_104028-1 [Araneus ventricosus]|uniref:Uncharacterized protein n=1 Tax=Araneus ventricosus TaxID=182803 RepID=A0A4Y2TH21_ARAVE|nr:hypothetical protein AVEN_104028-1 [Araneus ventricosus]
MDSKWWNSKELKIQNSNSRFQFGPRCEASGRTMDLPTLAPRVEARNETRNPPCRGGGVTGERNSATLNVVSKLLALELNSSQLQNKQVDAILYTGKCK